MCMKYTEWLLLLDINHVKSCHWDRSASRGCLRGGGRFPVAAERCVSSYQPLWKQQKQKAVSICFWRAQRALLPFLGALGNNVWCWFSALPLECCKLINSFYNTDCHYFVTWKELKVRPCLSYLAHCSADVGFWHDCCSNCFVACSRVSFPL